MKKQTKSKGLKLYDFSLDGKGLSKNNNIKESGFKRFFISLKDNFGKIFGVNMLMVIGNFPAIFLIAVLSGFTRNAAYLPSSDLFQNLSGVMMIEKPSPFIMTMYALEGLPNEILINTPLTYVFLGIGALVIFTFGLVNVGSAYVLRNIAMGEPVFVWTDFIYSIKRNWKQALPFGIIDALINALLIFNLYTTVTASDFITSVMFWSNVLLVILYFFMRPYIYIQMVTFKLTVFKNIKNALIFTLLGFKRNIISLLGCAVLLLLEIAFIFGAGGLLLSLGVALPFLILFSLMAYIKVFAAYFKIKEIMIEPYKQEHPEEFEDETYSDDDIIMRDDVTEKERLEQIKKRNGIAIDDEE